MSLYQLQLTNNTETCCLQLRKSNHVIRNWFGGFAELIWKKLILKNPSVVSEVSLNKIQVHNLYLVITCLYQRSIHKYKINQDLRDCDFSQESFIIAQSLLLQIRINHCHPSYDDLLAHYFDEYKDCNNTRFDKILNTLIANNLIQAIETDDDRQYYDKNITPHDHLYFKKQQKLVDCNTEIKNFLVGINCPKFIKKNHSILFTLNSNLT